MNERMVSTQTGGLWKGRARVQMLNKPISVKTGKPVKIQAGIRRTAEFLSFSGRWDSKKG